MPADTSTRRALATRLLALLDLTSLGEDDSPAHIEALCRSAHTPYGFPAAVCVYPEHVGTVRRALQGTPVKVATVVNFPDGGSDPMRISYETRRAIAAGADEIDLVLPYRAFARGEAVIARNAVIAGRNACKEGVTLKLILETGELATQGAGSFPSSCSNDSKHSPPGCSGKPPPSPPPARWADCCSDLY